MRTNVEGFNLEVTAEDGRPHVRVSLRDGQTVMDTSAVSATGLERLQRVFREAAWQAVRELEHYYATQAYKETGRAGHMGDGHGTVRRV